MNNNFYRKEMSHFDLPRLASGKAGELRVTELEQNVILSLSKDDRNGMSHFDLPRLNRRVKASGLSVTKSNVILSLSKDDGREIRYFNGLSVIDKVYNFRLTLLYLLIFLSSITAQTAIWFPKEINVQPFTANFLEPKSGFLFNTSNDKIRLDIGTSQDILHIINQNDIFSFGADLFTYTRLRSEKDFHFPVETIDYFFGINASAKRIFCDNEVGLRFRFSHISAHLVDGQFDKTTNQWRDGRLPQVYSREFIELFPFIRFYDLRFYAGLTYIFHSSPKEIKKGIYQIGFDYFATIFSFGTATPFIAYDFKLSGKEKYVGNNFINFGMKFGQFNKKGFSIYYSYISGMSVHGEYLGINENYSSLGFNLDL